MDLLDHHVPKDTDTGLFTVDTFNDPHAALFKFKSSMYDLLLIDIRMPEMSGYDLYKEIRKIVAKIKVIFLTASEPFEDFQKVFPTFDMNYYVLKPVEITEFSGWLKYYSNVFDFVEIDSSFYRIPTIFMVKNWYKRSPQNFRFTAKFPKIITHDKRLKDVDKELEQFFEAISSLADKTLALLIQLPPSLHIFEGLERLRDIVPELDTRFRYAVEVRHASWFQDLAYNFFANKDICLVWSQLAGLQTPPILTTDFLYLRFIGDRSIQEKDFGRIQLDRVLEMEKWAENIMTVEDERTKLAIIAANNHYAGFGPGTANVFRNMLGLPEAKWEDTGGDQQQEASPQDDLDAKQSTLSDFLD